jgi:hypothetical protein
LIFRGDRTDLVVDQLVGQRQMKSISFIG